jgi:hypothetical protein
MDWNARSAWLYKGSVPDINKARLFNIQVIYVDPTSNNVEGVIQVIRDNGLVAGAYFADSWTTTTANQFADWISETLNDILPKGRMPEAPPCMLDFERADRNWQENCLNRYRAHQPARPTSYTNAPFQGKLVPVSALVKHDIHLYVQLYYGDMRPADQSAAILELMRYGMPASKTHPFYDGARYSADARDGCYFTLERMP